ncbi:MAG: Phosphoenolpyruvate synthase, partial [Labilithrix sp.]|nr:Phosphoenolpyruvate synthase [Labilithrix sp.]
MLGPDGGSSPGQTFGDKATDGSGGVTDGSGGFLRSLSIAVQTMVRSDLAASGVMFTLDTDSGFRDVVLIDAAWGLGENVVKGTVAIV